MTVIVKWYKNPKSPVLSRKCALAFIVLIVFVVYAARLRGKWSSVKEIGRGTDEPATEKFSTSPKSCSPRRNVLFLKTHKTGSSTITNILNRYGEYHNLTVALPHEGFYNFYWPLSFEKSYMKDLNGNKPNILCNHARWNEHAMTDLMEKDAMFTTILRDPVTQFESTFSYMEFADLLDLKDSKHPMDTFFADPKNIMANFSRNLTLESVIPYLNLLRNGQFFDLGLESAYFDDDKMIDEAVSRIADSFNLVLLMEYFDESLVLLSRELCWDIRDVVYFKLNQRRTSDKDTEMSEELIGKIRRWNKADAMLYDFFNRTFWKKVEKFGEEFQNDVERLRHYNKVLEEACLVPGEHDEKAYAKQSKNIRGYALKKNIDSRLMLFCAKMATSEINYIQRFRKIN